MKKVAVRVAARKEGGSHLLAVEAALAARFWQRARGLLGRRPLAPGQGLVLRPCKAVHTWGLGYPIDVAFLDPDGVVLASYGDLAPNRRTRWHPAAACAVELPAGALERAAVAVGDRLHLDEP